VSLAATAALAGLDDPESAVEIPLSVDANARVEIAAILSIGRRRGSQQDPDH
jgi:hypothetical protein